MKLREQKGSMAVYVTVVLVGMLFILMAVFFISNSVRRTQLQTNLKVKEAYEADNAKADQIYASLTREEEDGEENMPAGWDKNKVTAVVSDDGITVPVPIGYTASSAKGENTVNGGFVIYEDTDPVTDENVNTAMLSRNQFVWIPVNNINQIANISNGIDENGRQNYTGKLYQFTDSGATEIENYDRNNEPATISTDENNLNILNVSSLENFQEMMQEEYNEIIESIDIYGGFYIGRYETGNLASDTTTKTVSVKNNNQTSNVSWYYVYMNSKKVAVNNNVKGSMIWGSLWDRTLIWLTETGDKTYAELMDSSYWGNYSTATSVSEIESTGSNDKWKANNIYDLAGNLWELTMEATINNARIVRGGYILNTGESSSVPAKGNAFTNYPDEGGGSRLVLYISTD